MPRTRIPLTGTTICWPPAEAGRIRIDATLHVSGQIKVELSFKRDPFRKLFKRSEYWYGVRSIFDQIKDKWPCSAGDLRRLLNERELSLFLHALPSFNPDRLTPIQSSRPDKLLKEWGFDIINLLHDSMADPSDLTFSFWGDPHDKPKSRKSLQVLNGSFCGVEYRLTIEREALQTLNTVLASKDGTRGLLFELQLRLLPTMLISWALRGKPHGPRGLAREEVMVVARCAIYAAEELVKRASEDPTLRVHLEKILTEEECGRETRQSIQIMTLAERTLRPALNKFKLQPLVGRKISAVLDAASRKELAEMFQVAPERLTGWFDHLLGPEGKASYVLKLLNLPD